MTIVSFYRYPIQGVVSALLTTVLPSSVFTPFALWSFSPSQKTWQSIFPESSPSCILLWLIMTLLSLDLKRTVCFSLALLSLPWKSFPQVMTVLLPWAPEWPHAESSSTDNVEQFPTKPSLDQQASGQANTQELDNRLFSCEARSLWLLVRNQYPGWMSPT